MLFRSIQAANDAPGRDPKHWKLLGSNDGSNWTVVDQQSGVAFPERHFTRVFEVAKPGAYNLYRLDVQQNLGDSNSQIAELDLLVEKGQEAPALDAALQQLLANREQGLAPLFAPDFSNAIVNPGSWVFEEDGVLVPRGGGEIWSQEPYGDFLIDLEFKCVDDTNSGVLLRCANIKRWVQTTIEVQILQPENPNKKHECGGIFDCLEPRRRALKPVGEWNHYTIIARGPDIHVILNGEYVTHLDVDLWTTANQNPDGTRNKFSTAYRDMAREGHLGLQYHGQQVWFRNVRVKRLD